MFVDEAEIYIESGKGGNGCSSFHREKFMPSMGPDGGDGGKGGDIVFVADPGLNTLYDFRHKTRYIADKGQDGRSNKCSGKKAEDLIIKVPLGTIVRESESNQVIVDLHEPGQSEIVLFGGKGGKGNQHFATSTMQMPAYAQQGQEGKSLNVKLELKVLAEVGLLGYPNAGKSTFLSRVSNARPKIANYPFTTLVPNLGVVNLSYGKTLVIADIPGLIDGASEGNGLGHEFLKHLERTRVLIHLVDLAGVDGRDPIEDLVNINKELSLFSEELAGLPQVIGANKADLITDLSVFDKFKEYCENLGLPCYLISTATGEGVQDLLNKVVEIRDSLPPEPQVFEREYFPHLTVEGADNNGINVTKTNKHEFTVDGEAVWKMLGFTHLETEKGFAFFQKFLKDRGILAQLEAMGIEEGDTVIVGTTSFEYYP